MLRLRLWSFFALTSCFVTGCTGGAGPLVGSGTQTETTPEKDKVAVPAAPDDSDEPSEPTEPSEPSDPGTGMNPYGVAYPKLNIGTQARAGTKRGNVMANHGFADGYAPNGKAKKAVQLADLFDPEGRTHDAVAIIAGARWDAYTQNVAEALGANPPSRVAVLFVIGESTSPGKLATVADLDAFRTASETSWAANARDAGFNQLGVYFDAAAVPWVGVLDARTMEIVSSGVGAPSNPTADLEELAADIVSRPPAY